jgi:hypothetical protein
MMKQLMPLVLTLLLGSVVVSGKSVDGQVFNEFQLDKAREAAAGWLLLIDGGDYDLSWVQSDKVCQRSIIRETWPDAATKLRGDLGRLVSRRFKGRQYFERLPGVPDGPSVVMTFAADFENRKGVDEMLTVVFEGPRGWRVAGYRIR